MGYTSLDIINSIKLRGLIPTAQKTFAIADFITLMDEVQRNIIVPMMMSVRENYFVSFIDTPIVSGQNTYPIYSRAMGMKLKNVYYVVPGLKPRRMVMVELDRLADIAFPSELGDPCYFYFQDNDFVVIPTPSTSQVGSSFRQYFFQQRNTIINPADCGQITSISGNTIGVNATPLTFNTTVLYDFVKGTPGFNNLAINQALTSVSGTSLVFTAAVPSNLAIGDYVCLAGQSPVPQIPYDLFPVLSQGVVQVCLTAINDLAGAQKAKDTFDVLSASALKQICVRAEEQSKKLVSPNNISGYIFHNFGWRW